MPYKKLLIIGAQPNSLGEHIVKEAQSAFWDTYTAGLGQSEDYFVNVQDPLYVQRLLGPDRPHDWDSVVCTVGINIPQPFIDGDEQWSDAMVAQELVVNALGPMLVLDQWLRNQDRKVEPNPDDEPRWMPLPNRHFVAISSNSAHIARSNSMGYCMSKAALSMGIRVAAREVARKRENIAIYGYEPGWLCGTPMSDSISRVLSPSVQRHRIPTEEPMDTRGLARLIVKNLSMPWDLINGMLLRVDGGEQ
jgi:NAD(P)-dependent dehydrogenase (short-subunit alcohol dehydrogenase family)